MLGCVTCFMTWNRKWMLTSPDVFFSQYLTFGSNVASNILVMYPHSSLFVAIGRLGIVLMVIASYPLQVHPCRAAVDKILATVLKESDEVELEGVPDDTSDAGNDNAAGETGGGVAVKRIKEMGRTRFIALTAGIVTIGLAVALTVDELETGGSLYSSAIRVSLGRI